MPQTRAAYMRTYIKARRKVRRARLIELLGGRCVSCGSTDELEFDHIDPETKVFAVGSDMSRAWDKLVEEALKCQLLCRECHVAKGIEDRPEPAHSYYRYWYYGCLCATCKAANARKSARQRERKTGGKVGMISFPTIPTATKPLVKLPRRDSNTEPAG
jgi:hypothetical protein